MLPALRLPPSARDFDVYRRIVVYGFSTRQVAQEHNLSQTRVRQIADRVGYWIAKVLPCFEIAEENGLRMARQLAAERLDYFYSQAMHGWNVGNNPRCLALALRITMATARLPCIPGRLEALAVDVTEGPLPSYLNPQACIAAFQQLEDEQRQLERAAASQPTEEPPPDKDCSPKPASGAAEEENTAPDFNATAAVAINSERLLPRRAAARRAFLSPAQQDFERPAEPPENGDADEGIVGDQLDLHEKIAAHCH